MKYKNYDITVIVTHRCNAKCNMCNSHENPTKPDEEINLQNLEVLPMSRFIQITGGEPFVRTDIEKVVEVLNKKAKRLMINTNGYYTERIVSLAKKYPNIAIRISLDGRRKVHNSIRGIDIYDKALDTLLQLKELGIRDLGISFTLQECNYNEMLPMYHMALDRGVDFGVSVVHNSFYFSKENNQLNNKDYLKTALKKLINEQLRSKRKKDWARAYYNEMSIRYLYNLSKPVHCDAGVSSFVIDVDGKVLPCNMTHAPWVMGDLKEQSWNEILNNKSARKIVEKCKHCKINCWSMCNVQSALKKKIWIPMTWLIRRKFLNIQSDH